MKKAYLKYGFLLIALSLLSGCLKDETFKLKYQGYEPQIRNDGWITSTPENEHMDTALLESAYHILYEDERFTMARSLLIIRNGKLVSEAYPHDPDDIDRIANLQSITKSFTSILTGIALEKNILDSVHQTLYSIYPEAFTDHPDKTTITLEDALTMRTGIDFNNDTDTELLYHAEGSTLNLVLSYPMNHPPGVVFHYHDGAPHLVSYAIQKRAGKSLEAFAAEHLFQPLGITDWKWEAAQDGTTFGAFSLYLKPRDAARFGQLLLQNGKWDNQQIVDSSWVATATYPHVTSHLVGAPYGYYFWIYPVNQGYEAYGHGGQKIYVVPELNLVVVYTAWGYTSDDFFDNFNELADLITKSCY